MSLGRFAIFDIDGTLTNTSAVDDACYIRAVREEWGVDGISTDWGAYEHSTDNAIAAQISRERRRREATSADLAALRDRFARLIREAHAREPALFTAIAGAREVFAALKERGWQVAIATGGWTPTARFKLERAGIDATAIPAAFACDARARSEIVAMALARAEASTGQRAREVVYVGDGTWDLSAARQLGVGFVGRAEGERRAGLRAAGATESVADFRDVAALAGALERAAVAIR